MSTSRNRIRYPDGSFVRRDPLTGLWNAHPRKGRVLKNAGDGLVRPYPTAEAAVAEMRELGYAAEPARPEPPPAVDPATFAPGEAVIWNAGSTLIPGRVVTATEWRVVIEMDGLFGPRRTAVTAEKLVRPQGGCHAPA